MTLNDTITALGNSIINLIDKKTPTATASTVGMVKPDGTTITVTEDGTISSVGGGSSSGGAVWGEITGTLNKQTDLKQALAKKQNAVSIFATSMLEKGWVIFPEKLVFQWGNAKIAAGETWIDMPSNLDYSSDGNYNGFEMGSEDSFDPRPIFITITPRLVVSTDVAPVNPQVLITEITHQKFKVKNYSGQDLVISFFIVGLES